MPDRIKRTMDRTKFREVFGMRHNSQVNAFAERWGFTLEEGGDVDLVAALVAVVESYERDVTGSMDLKDAKIREEIEKLKHHNASKRLENETLAGERIEVGRILPLLNRHAGELRGAGDMVARKTTLTGRECQDVINVVVDALERDIERTFGSGATGQ